MAYTEYFVVCPSVIVCRLCMICVFFTFSLFKALSVPEVWVGDTATRFKSKIELPQERFGPGGTVCRREFAVVERDGRGSA